MQKVKIPSIDGIPKTYDFKNKSVQNNKDEIEAKYSLLSLDWIDSPKKIKPLNSVDKPVEMVDAWATDNEDLVFKEDYSKNFYETLQTKKLKTSKSDYIRFLKMKSKYNNTVKPSEIVNEQEIKPEDPVVKVNQEKNFKDELNNPNLQMSESDYSKFLEMKEKGIEILNGRNTLSSGLKKALRKYNRKKFRKSSERVNIDLGSTITSARYSRESLSRESSIHSTFKDSVYAQSKENLDKLLNIKSLPTKNLPVKIMQSTDKLKGSSIDFTQRSNSTTFRPNFNLQSNEASKHDSKYHTFTDADAVILGEKSILCGKRRLFPIRNVSDDPIMTKTILVEKHNIRRALFKPLNTIEKNKPSNDMPKMVNNKDFHEKFTNYLNDSSGRSPFKFIKNSLQSYMWNLNSIDKKVQKNSMPMKSNGNLHKKSNSEEAQNFFQNKQNYKKFRQNNKPLSNNIDFTDSHMDPNRYKYKGVTTTRNFGVSPLLFHNKVNSNLNTKKQEDKIQDNCIKNNQTCRHYFSDNNKLDVFESFLAKQKMETRANDFLFVSNLTSKDHSVSKEKPEEKETISFDKSNSLKSNVFYNYKLSDKRLKNPQPNFMKQNHSNFTSIFDKKEIQVEKKQKKISLAIINEKPIKTDRLTRSIRIGEKARLISKIDSKLERVSNLFLSSELNSPEMSKELQSNCNIDEFRQTYSNILNKIKIRKHNAKDFIYPMK